MYSHNKFKSSVCIPLVVLGDIMKNSYTVRIKAHVSGTTAILEREIKLKSRNFRAAIVSIDKFKTSKVSI